MKRVIVGVDDSESAAAALGWAVRLAARADAELVVANVFEPSDAELPPHQFDELVGQAEVRLADLVADQLGATDVTYRCLLLTGSPDALPEAADREDVDLVVVGQRGGRGFAGLHLGSVAHHLAHNTHRPLAIIPEPGANVASGTVVVGVDGSEGSRAAVAWCADLAGVTKDEVLAVHASESVPEPDPVESHRSTQHLMDTEWIDPLRHAGVTVRTRIVHDVHSVVALAAAAESEGAGLIVVGARKTSDIVGVRLGRVPIQLVNQTTLPVVMVPPPPPEER